MPNPKLANIPWTALLSVLLAIAVVRASSGDRNPTFQHCLKGCKLTYCDPSQSPLPVWLRAFGWTCEDDCKYQCAHSFTDNIRSNSQWHQFYGKWPFYRLGPIQEPLSFLMSLGNLYVNLRGLSDLKRRVRPENKLRRWLEVVGWAQVNTWVWSAVFHSRDTPVTERLDYFSATLTVALSLLYAVVRILHFQTPRSTSRLTLPAAAIVAFLVISHFTYLLSFPLGAFPYGYHTQFVVFLGMIHNVLWILWSLSFRFPFPSFNIGGRTMTFPAPYPPNDPLKVRSTNAMTPLSLVVLTLFAMSFELLDFRPIWRVIDAHSMWHAFTIPLAVAWWGFFTQDALDFEGSLINGKVLTGGGAVGEKVAAGGIPTPVSVSEKNEKLGLRTPRTPTTPTFVQAASSPGPPRNLPSPRTPSKEGRVD